MTTIFTDASVDQSCRTAGWGAWIKCSGRPALTTGGPIRTPVAASNDAELFAIVNAVAVASRRLLIVDDGIVMLQSDSLQALCFILAGCPDITTDRPAKGGLVVGPMKLRPKTLTPQRKRSLEVLREIAAFRRIVYITRHVRGHQPAHTEDGRAQVNRAIDKLARFHMRQELKRLEGKP